MFRSQDIQAFVFITIPWFTESVTSRRVLVLETRYIFEYIFWTTTHEITFSKCSKMFYNNILSTIMVTLLRAHIYLSYTSFPGFFIGVWSVGESVPQLDRGISKILMGEGLTFWISNWLSWTWIVNSCKNACRRQMSV